MNPSPDKRYVVINVCDGTAEAMFDSPEKAKSFVDRCIESTNDPRMNGGQEIDYRIDVVDPTDSDAELRGRIDLALSVARRYGSFEGHSKGWTVNQAWVVDRIVRAITGCKLGGESEEYKKFLSDYKKSNEVSHD